MTEHEASRTLVKSPPELWAECSEAASLARHMGQFGEIRITKLEPETAVAWEGEEVSGTVRLEPSGWGTKVILTARATEEQQTRASESRKPDTKKAPIQEPNPAESELKDPAVKEPPSAGEPDPVEESPGADEPHSVEEPPPPPDPEPEPDPLPPAATAAPPAVTSERKATPPPPPAPRPESVRRPGLIAKLMALFQPPDPAPAPAAPASTPPPGSNGARASTPPPSCTLPPETRPAAAPRPAAASARTLTPSAVSDAAVPSRPPELSDAEESAAVDHAAVLSAALDSLGQAHHRPFSRA
jgi:hypothetical protein